MDQVARGAAASPALPRFQNPHSLVAQEYIAAWIQKTERIGDLNYPGDMTGQLEIRVALNADGSLESVRIIHSSGNSALDRATLRVVRLGAPYAPFSRELLQATHRLVIRCGMNFLGEKHLSARLGGWVLPLILLAALAAIGIILNRLWILRRSRVSPKPLIA